MTNPYESPLASLNDAPSVSQLDELEYAGFWRRLGATMLDLLAMIAATVALDLLIPFGLVARAADVVLSCLIYCGYILYFNATSGQTPGKRLLGIRTQRVDGQPLNCSTSLRRNAPSLLQSLIQSIGGLISVFKLGNATINRGSLLLNGADLYKQGPHWDKQISLFAIIFLFGEIISFFATTKKQSLHDLLAKTIVVKVRRT